MPPPRAIWKGHLKLSLVSFAVRVHNATTSAGRIALNQLHKDCNRRVQQKLACPVHGVLDKNDIVKGYEYEKDRYVVVDPEDLDKIRIESTKAIEITQFVDRAEIDPIHFDAPYYVAPDGPVAESAFRVIREALKRSDKLGIGRYVIGGRENVVVLDVKEKGLLMTTLRSNVEVRAAKEYFEEIGDGAVDEKQLELAAQLIENHTAPLDPAVFNDRYRDAMLEIIKAKVEGKEPSIIEAEEVPTSLSFMDALRASVDRVESAEKKPPAKSVRKPAAKRKKA
jgi:DNA end-binding protein Ku